MKWWIIASIAQIILHAGVGRQASSIVRDVGREYFIAIYGIMMLSKPSATVYMNTFFVLNAAAKLNFTAEA